MPHPQVRRLEPSSHAAWADLYPEAPPIGFLLRDSYPDRWLRIHNLPNAKRRPTSGWEYAELLRRHNEVGSFVVGGCSSCALVLFGPCGENVSDKLTNLAMVGGEGLQHLGELPPELWDEDNGVFVEPMCLFGAAVEWVPRAFNGFIGAVSEAKVAGLFADLEGGRVYAPYDGGADLFFPNDLERELAGERFRSWLSPRGDGL